MIWIQSESPAAVPAAAVKAVGIGAASITRGGVREAAGVAVPAAPLKEEGAHSGHGWSSRRASVIGPTAVVAIPGIEGCAATAAALTVATAPVFAPHQLCAAAAAAAAAAAVALLAIAAPFLAVTAALWSAALWCAALGASLTPAPLAPLAPVALSQGRAPLRSGLAGRRLTRLAGRRPPRGGGRRRTL